MSPDSDTIVHLGQQLDLAREVLKELVADINLTGGVIIDRKGRTAPAANEDWTYLGATYRKACNVLDVCPKITRDDRKDRA
ncbi:MAG: hypothetical protein WC869_00030 [Phycisphaerae bacterium]|jgi:hypothetical protein